MVSRQRDLAMQFVLYQKRQHSKAYNKEGTAHNLHYLTLLFFLKKTQEFFTKQRYFFKKNGQISSEPIGGGVTGPDLNPSPAKWRRGRGALGPPFVYGDSSPKTTGCG